MYEVVDISNMYIFIYFINLLSAMCFYSKKMLMLPSPPWLLSDSDPPTECGPNNAWKFSLKP